MSFKVKMFILNTQCEKMFYSTIYEQEASEDI